jgi:hypothetical protein
MERAAASLLAYGLRFGTTSTLWNMQLSTIAFWFEDLELSISSWAIDKSEAALPHVGRSHRALAYFPKMGTAANGEGRIVTGTSRMSFAADVVCDCSRRSDCGR